VKILAIDTSGKQAGAAIVDEYITIGEILINAQSGPKTWHHSEILMPGVERLFELCGYSIQDMDCIAYTSGPGSFTGIRIGASTALGLARAVEKPAVAVPTLDALAYNMLSIEEGRIVVPLMDARREQVYGAIYKKESDRFTRLTDYFGLGIDEALDMLETDAIFLGDGADENKDAILARFPNAWFAPPNANRQRAASVGLCAMRQQVSDKVELIYVRDPQAVRNLKQS